MAREATAVNRPVSRREFMSLGALGAVATMLGGCGRRQTTSSDAARAAAAEIPDGEPVAQVAALVGPSVVQVNVEATQTDPFSYQGWQESPFDSNGRGGPEIPQSQESQQGVGSGVIYREDGHVITNAHVVQGATEVNVAFAEGSTESGRVLGTDAVTDIAVVKVERNNLPVARFGEGAKLAVGQLAVAIGSPSGFQSTVTSGVISGLGREVSAEYTGGHQEDSLVDLIQTDAAISPGSSGGALANRAGEVVGINVAYLSAETGAEGIGFAIPAYTAVSVADQLIASGRAVHPYLGVSVADLDSETSRQFAMQPESGAVVVRVDPDGPAARAGIEPHDVITALDSVEVEGSADLLGVLRRYEPGDTVRLRIARNGQARQVGVRLGERGADI
jgi:serine protease Do